MSLGALLRARKAEILDRWARAITGLPKARTLSAPVLLDQLPSLLDAIADAADQTTDEDDGTFPESQAIVHALHRLDAGFNLEEVMFEYTVLRQTVADLIDSECLTVAPRQLRILHEALDIAMTDAVTGYASVERQVLMAIDRVVAAGLDTSDVDHMLSRLLKVFVEAAAPVDTVVVLLRKGDSLRVRASIGFDREMRDVSLPLEESFPGAVAREKRPLAIPDAGHGPLVTIERVRATGLKALYSVPLLEGEHVIGVAEMGSRSASVFSQEQEVLFRAMAGRAASMIAHALAVARDRAAHITARALLASGTLDEAADRLLADIGEAFRWDMGIYWRHDGGALHYRHGWTAPHVDLTQFHELSRGFRFDRGSGLPGRAWQSGGVEWIARVGTDENLPRKAAAIRAGLHSAIAFPLSTADTTIGVLEFFSRTPRVAVEEAVEMTAVIGEQLPQFVGRLEAQEQLQLSEAHKSAMLDVALDCVIGMNSDGRVTAWNPAAAQTLGYSADEAIGRELAQLIIPPELRTQHRAGLARYLSTGEHIYLNRRIEVPAVRRDGTRIVVELAITRVPVGGPPVFTGYLRDITDRRRAEDEQQQLYRQAEEAGRMRERLLAIVAHDLRNPLAATITGATLLLNSDAASDATVRRRAEAILRAAGRMDRLISDLLDTANIHRGHLSMERRLQPLASIVTEAVDVHQPAAAEKGVHLTMQIDLGNAECLCDRDRILQVLANLIGNAIKFCRAGDSVGLRAGIVDGAALIEVADTGPGISANDLPRIFEPYWSSQRGGTDSGERSTGLGLFISKGIVEGHGGRLSAQSTPGEGTAFRLTLPLDSLISG